MLLPSTAQSVDVSGTLAGAITPSLLSSSATFLSTPLQQLLRLPPVLSGNSGDVTINTKWLSVTDGARVDVSNLGQGNAGRLTINANSISLDRVGAITAATTSGEGGNIDLNVRDFLLLRNNSQITTSAGGNGNGGNIRINAGSIVAVPTENSDIRANSVNARGGNVTINASGIFGLQFRSQDTPLSDITATGANSALRGTVQLNINRLDPTSGLVKLPTTVADSSRLIVQGCPANQGNSFVISGRGGLPPTPEQQLDDDAEWSDRRRLTVAQQMDSGRGRHGDAETGGRGEVPDSKFKIQNSKFPNTPIVEATGWQITPTGEVFLVATTTDLTVQNRLYQVISCQGR